MARYNPKEIEPKWQAKWDADGIYQATEDPAKPKKYILEYFPYPSGAAMHVGHVRNYTIGDALARYNRMQGFNVLHPMGWDAFGLPAENYAIKHKVSPKVAIKENTGKFKQQLMQMGFSYDWSREVNSSDPSYYKWTQWLFLLLFKRGLAYQQESLQWWCPVDKTVLANEQVESGKCWRCGSEVEKKALKQWFFKITEYADRLLDDLDDLNWTEAIKSMQRNWIGRSIGAEVDFAVELSDLQPNYVLIHGYTGRADKNFIPALKADLEKRGYQVQAPQLPNTDDPKEDEQVNFVLEECTIDENTVLLGHSLGGSVAMKVLQRLEHSVRELVLVAPVVEPDFRTGEPRPFWDDWTFDYNYSDITAKAGRRVILSDHLEDETRKPYLDYLSGKIDAPVLEATATKQHFTGEHEPFIHQQLLPSLRVFTTRPDTLFGSTFMVLAPEHPLVPQLTTSEQRPAVEEYVKAAQAKSDVERQETNREKTGVFTGAYATNPVNGEKIPIWVADYVLAGYGTGAIMAVPAHDERDFEFAQKFDIPITWVYDQAGAEEGSWYAGEGTMKNSESYDGLSTSDAREQIVADLAKQGVAHEQVNYKMRDWLISRQRYWGAPIPIIHCPTDGAVPVPDNQLPVELPDIDSYEPSGDGRSPLARVKEFVETTCPKCGGPAERETDTMDGFACSSWYFLRFADPQNDAQAFDAEKAKFWLPVDDYIGGAEHAVMHLLYARFWTKVMFDEGLINFQEPFKTLRNQGMILAPDGAKMSKSKGNTIEPDSLLEQGYGADSIRLMELFIGPWNQESAWSVEGMAGAFRFLQRVWTLVNERDEKAGMPSQSLQQETHRAIKRVTTDLNELGFNTAISALMEFVNALYKLKLATPIPHATLRTLVQLLAPFAPHIAEELWQQLGGTESVHLSSWPEWDESYLTSDHITVVVQVNGKVRANIEVAADATEQTVTAAAQAIPHVANYLQGHRIIKTIFVPGKLINFVAR